MAKYIDYDGTPMDTDDDLELEEAPGNPEPDLLTREAFLDGVGEGCLTDYDGHGDMLDAEKRFIGPVFPSTSHTMPAHVTHVRWYNK